MTEAVGNSGNTPDAPSNIFTILGVATREDAITNALAFAVNNSPKFADYLVGKLAPSFGKLSLDWRAYARIQTSAGVPDLVLSGSKDDAKALLVIENKLAAEEGEDQTERYASEQCKADLRARLGTGEGPLDIAFAFLSLFPDIRAKSPAFCSYTHQVLCDHQPESVGDVGRLIGDWISLLKSFYEHDNLKMSEPVMVMLQDDPLEGGYLYFNRIMQAVNPVGLEFNWCDRSSRQGRRFYLANFSKANWQAGRWIAGSGQWSFDRPERHFNIHIEPQFSPLNGQLKVYLHYETNEYETEEWTRKNLLPAHLEAYLLRRSTFVEKLAAIKHPSLVVGGRWNQVARSTISLDGMSTEAAVRELTACFSEITEAVDLVLAQMD